MGRTAKIAAATFALAFAFEAFAAPPRSGARMVKKVARADRSRQAATEPEAPPAAPIPAAIPKETAAVASAISETEKELRALAAAPSKADDNPYANINEDNCEYHYNLCMNKVCTDTKIGKC
ncbi:MAG: hypothetical protein LBI17_03820, partial [Rickettsiales bacterium]|nr:hypothetical protein [Rickettsiales bacterium]